MGGELRNKVASGVAWSLSEKVGTILLQMVVSIVVARLLMPDDVGVMALMTFFTSLALVVVDSGFSQMLIRKSDPDPCDYKSVFLFNIVVSWVVYLLLVALFPWVAAFYEQPVLARIAPVLFLLIPVNALGSIQNTLFTRQVRFALLSKITFFSSLVSGALAVTMALAGCGVWSLVGQRLSSIAVRSALLWFFSGWRPRPRKYRSGVLRHHVLKNALVPVVTFLAQTMAEIVAGSIIVEQVFAIPGLGRLLVASIGSRDYPVVQAIVVILALWVVLAGTVADLINQRIDPRLRLGGGA